MRTLLFILSASTIALAAPLQAQHGGGHGGGHGQANAGGGGHAEQGGGGHGNGHMDRGGGGGDDGQRGRGHEQHVSAQGPDRGHEAHVAENGSGRGHGRGHAEDRGRGPIQHVRNEDVLRPGVRLDDRGRGNGHGPEARHVERRAMVVRDPARIERIRWEPQRFVVRGCPPGLARKHNGCMPPGQARHLLDERGWYDRWWPRYGEGAYRYSDGYLVRLVPSGAIDGFIPLAGGPLWVNNPWPANYAYDPVPRYFVDYNGWNQPYDYRYADGIVYGLDPQTQMIQQVAGLLTGDPWAVGQPMPAGYDVYNVPYAYRGQYYDTPNSMYRYSDGYIYQMDPTTQLVQSIISLIA